MEAPGLEDVVMMPESNAHAFDSSRPRDAQNDTRLSRACVALLQPLPKELLNLKPGLAVSGKRGDVLGLFAHPSRVAGVVCGGNAPPLRIRDLIGT